LAAALAEVDGDRSAVLILSALHGLVSLDTVLAPYDVKMGDAGSIDTLDLEATFLAHGLNEDGVDLYCMLPQAYFAALDAVARRYWVYPADVYEATAGIGEQKHVAAVIRDWTDPFAGEADDVPFGQLTLC
jgi:hypothetical protein